MRALVLAVAVAFASLPAHAAAAIVGATTIIEAGEFTADHTRSVAAPKSLGGSVSLLTNLRLVAQTDIICPRQGLRFGIRYKVDGWPNGTRIKVVGRIAFPAPGIKTPRGEVKPASEMITTVMIGKPHVQMFTFIADWTMAHGPWVFEVRYGRRLLARKQFIVQCAIA